MLDSLSISKCPAVILGIILATATVLLLILRVFIGRHEKFDVKGVHCVVTGGSSGIGKEVAKQLAREGAHVTIVARKQEVLDSALREIEDCKITQDQRAQTVSVDVGASFEGVKASLDGAVAKLGDAEVLANCAGFSIPLEFDLMDVADYERLLRVNTLGSMYTTRALLPRMKANRRGRILFTSSIAGQIGLYGFTAYSASKFAIVGLAQALQMEVKCYGIAVSVSYPPDTDTPGFEVENTGKPEVTRLISEGGGIFSPQQVAAGIVEGIKAGKFSITCGMDGYLVSLGTAGFAPCFSMFEAIMQVLAASALRLATLYYNWGFYRLATRAGLAAGGVAGKERSKKTS